MPTPDEPLRHYLRNRMESLLRQHADSHAQYRAIWDLYEKHMSECVPQCTAKCRAYAGPEVEFDGPQGIYWIGATPRLLIAGKEHFGWYGEGSWPAGQAEICFAPLEFAYFTVPSMGAYWAVVKEIVTRSLDLPLADWDQILRHVALTNACKCLTNNRTLQWHLHEACLQNNFLQEEIRIVSAPVNILFTRAQDLARRLVPQTAETLLSDGEFLVLRHGSQIIIECAHPGRCSHDWRTRLTDLARHYLALSTTAQQEHNDEQTGRP